MWPQTAPHVNTIRRVENAVLKAIERPHNSITKHECVQCIAVALQSARMCIYYNAAGPKECKICWVVYGAELVPNGTGGVYDPR